MLRVGRSLAFEVTKSPPLPLLLHSLSLSRPSLVSSLLVGRGGRSARLSSLSRLSSPLSPSVRRLPSVSQSVRVLTLGPSRIILRGFSLHFSRFTLPRPSINSPSYSVQLLPIMSHYVPVYVPSFPHIFPVSFLSPLPPLSFTISSRLVLRLVPSKQPTVPATGERHEIKKKEGGFLRSPSHFQDEFDCLLSRHDFVRFLLLVVVPYLCYIHAVLPCFFRFFHDYIRSLFSSRMNLLAIALVNLVASCVIEVFL